MVIVLSFSILKMAVVVMQNNQSSHKQQSANKKQSVKARRAYFILLPIALIINLTSAGVEGIATFVLIRDIKVRGIASSLTNQSRVD